MLIVPEFDTNDYDQFLLRTHYKCDDVSSTLMSLLLLSTLM